MASFLDFVRSKLPRGNNVYQNNYEQTYQQQQQQTPSLSNNPYANSSIVGGVAYNPAGDIIGPADGQQLHQDYNYDALKNDYQNGGGGGEAAADPTPYRNQVLEKIHAIQAAYDSLTGNIGNIVSERAGQLNKGYGQQLDNLNKAFQTDQSQTASMYGARGLANSSFLGDAQGQNNDIYQQNMGNILDNKNNDLAGLGKYADSAKASYGQGRGAYDSIINNIGNYGATDLQNMLPQLGNTLSDTVSKAAGIGTNSQFINDLSKYTPKANDGVNLLANKLQQLVTSGAPHFAKNQIAQGLIKQAQLTDPSAVGYWNDYYQKLLNG